MLWTRTPEGRVTYGVSDTKKSKRQVHTLAKRCTSENLSLAPEQEIIHWREALEENLRLTLIEDS